MFGVHNMLINKSKNCVVNLSIQRKQLYFNIFNVQASELCLYTLNIRRFHTEMIIKLVDMECHLRDSVLILSLFPQISFCMAFLLRRILDYGHSCLFLCQSFKAYETTDHFILVLILLFRER